MDEIQFSTSDYSGSNPLYFVAFQIDTNEYVYVDDTTTSATDFQATVTLESYNASDWPFYFVSMPLDTITGLYNGNFPAAPNDTYMVTVYEQIGLTPSPSDIVLGQAEYEQLIEPASFANQLDLDGIAFINEFAEPITYQQYADDGKTLLGTYYINAVVNRELPQAIQEDGKNLADLIEINIANDEVLGVTSINKGRDKIVVSGKYGGPVKARLVSQMVNGDSGMWTVRCKGD